MRYILLLAILLYNILGIVISRHPTMNHDRDFDDRSGEAATRHQTHNAWRKKVLLHTELDERPPYKENREEMEKEEEIIDYKSKARVEKNTERRSDRRHVRRARNEQVSEDSEDRNPQREREIPSSEFVSNQEHLKSSRNREHPKQRLTEDRDDKKFVQKIDCDRTNERFESCFAGCAAVTCDNPRNRLRPCYPFCEPGCVCVPPYVRDDRTHKCVLVEDCSKGLKGIPDIADG